MKNSKLYMILKSSMFSFLFFLFFSSFTSAQSSTYYDIYRPQMDYSNIFTPQSDYTNIYTPRADYSDIYTPKSDRSDIYTLNRDLIDSHNPSLYESIHSNENNSNSLLIVKDKEGNIISIIHLNNERDNS